MHASDKPTGERLSRWEDSAGVAPFGCLANSNDARQEIRRARFWHDAAPGEHETKLRVLAGESKVHRQRHGDAHADRGAIDRSDHGLGAFKDPQRHHSTAVARNTRFCLDIAATVGECLASGTRQICASAEGAARSGDDHGPHVIVGVHLVECIDDLVHHRSRERIELLRPVERDRRDVVSDVVNDLRVLHGEAT